MKLPRKSDEIKILNLLNEKNSDYYSSNTFYFGRFSSLDEARKRLPTLRWFLKYFALNPRIASLETSRKVSKEYDAWSISAIAVEMIEKWNQEKKSDKESPNILKILLNLAENCLTKIEKHRPDCAKLLDYFLIEINELMVDVETPFELKNDIYKVFTIQSKQLKVENPLNVFYSKLINYQKNIILELEEEQKSLKKTLNSFKREFQTKKVKENAVRNLLKIYAGEKHIILNVHELKACFDGKLGQIILSCWKIIKKGYPALYDQLRYEKAQCDLRGKFLYTGSDPAKGPAKSDNLQCDL